MPTIDTFNKFLVSVKAANVIVLKPPEVAQPMNKEECLNLAAYLVTLSGATNEEFDETLKAVQRA